MPVACQRRAVTEPQRDSGTKCRRGRQSSDTSRVKKTEPSIKRLSLRGAKRRGNPHPLTLYVKHTAVSRRNGFPRPVTSVTGLATAAYHDSLICRLVPLGGMTTLFCSALSFPHCSSLYKVPIGKRQVRASPPYFLPPQVLFNIITLAYHAKGEPHGTDSRRPDHRRDAPHRLAALDADRGRRRRWHGSGLSNRSCRTASFTA